MHFDIFLIINMYWIEIPDTQSTRILTPVLGFNQTNHNKSSLNKTSPVINYNKWNPTKPSQAIWSNLILVILMNGA